MARAILLGWFLALSAHGHADRACLFLTSLADLGGVTDADLRAIERSPLENPFARNINSVSRHVIAEAYQHQLREADPESLSALASTLLTTRSQTEVVRQNATEATREPPGLPNFVVVEPGVAMDIPDYARIPGGRYQPERPFEIADKLLTEAQWVSLAGRPLPNLRGPPSSDFPAETHRYRTVIHGLRTRDPRHRYRLPTLHEWLYVASDRGRSGDALLGNFDPLKLQQQAWLAENADERPQAVGTRLPTFFDGQRLYDLIGLLSDLVQGDDSTDRRVGGDTTSSAIGLTQGRNWSAALSKGWGSPQKYSGIRLVREELPR